jgi:peptidoglycan/LPS O-acetylase OafA/YrhL
MSRLTFCAYLIHPAVLSFTFADQQQSPHYSIFWIISQFLGTLVLVFVLSAVVFLLVEKPLATVERLLLRGEGSPAQKKDK